MIKFPLTTGAKSYFRGWPIRWTGDRWVYEDTGEDLPATDGEVRPCRRCGELWELEKGDRCLGVLPGVDNACCGHGVEGEAYVRFTNGVVLKDFELEKPEEG